MQSTAMNEEEYIGEIIESSTIEFVAESRDVYAPPRLGSLVKVPLDATMGLEQVSPPPLLEDPFEESLVRNAGRFAREFEETVEEKPQGVAPAIFGVVYHASTTNTDTTRRRAYWKEEQQLKEEQPELCEWLLITEFRAIIVGYSEQARIRWHLPPRPPRIHCFVYPCTPAEICAFTSRMDFLRTIANFRNAPSEEVLAACIREAAEAHGANATNLKVKAGKVLANLLKDDYERLEAIIRRIES